MTLSFSRVLACALLVLVSSVAPGEERVRISEVLYHPADDETLEFVELYNPGSSEVDLLGWSFVGGIGYGFGQSEILRPGGVLVVARDRDALVRAFGVDPACVVGDFSGALDNAGETLTLVDGESRFREVLRFRDDFPFDPSADGRGASLHLRCLDRPASTPFNWEARAPTPGRYEAGSDCDLALPVPDLERFPIIINEIYYHPPGDPDPHLEFVELYHRGSARADLSFWRFDEGVHFTFPSGTRLDPGEYVLVAQDPEFLVERLSLDPERVLGTFEDGTRLSNSGEELRLVDARGELQDQVSYREDDDWPAHADGLGGSLQRVDPLGPSNASGNWRAAPVGPIPEDAPWLTFQVEGFHEGVRFYFYLLGAGEVLLDSVRLEDAGEGRDYFTNGEFDDGLTEWSGTGNHDDSEVIPEGGFGDGGPCLLVRAGGEGNGALDGVRHRLADRPAEEDRLVLTFHVKHLRGETTLVARSSAARPDSGFLYLEVNARTGDRGGESTPLKPNNVGGGPTPPTVRFLERSPLWPTSKDPVTITARIEAAGDTRVVAHYQVGDGDADIRTAPLADRGADGDLEGGDGLWTGVLPPAPDDSLVWFSLEATSESGQSTRWPRWKNPVATTGYYVVDERPEAPDPVKLFYIFTPGALRDLSCAAGAYREGSLVDETGRAYRDVGVKFRGETACAYPKKPLRVRFNKGDVYQGQSRLNFNAGWNDKSMLREQFAFDFFRDAGVAYSETHTARVHTNGGRFHGAYFAIEDPDEDYLRRNRRRTDGGLYKARSAMLNSATSGYEPRNDAAPGHLDAIRDFARDLNRLRGEALIAFLNEKLDVEGVIDYQAVQAIITDGDSVVKNWLLYYGRHELAGEGPPLVTCFPWDLDLTYGQMLLTTDVRHYDIHPLFQTRTYPFHDQGYHGILSALLENAPDDYYIKAFYGRIWRLLEEKFAPDVLLPELDRYEEATGDLARQDLSRWRRTWGSRGNDPDYWRADFRLYIERRYAFLKEFLTAENRTTLGRTFRYVPAPRLRFTEIHYNPADDGDLEFVEIASEEDVEIDLGGWTIPAVEYVFPEGTIAGPREVFLVARDPAALAAVAGLEGVRILGPYSGRLSGGGEILRLRDSGEDGRFFPETIDVVIYDDEGTWPAAADGGGPSLELAGAELDNDEAASWRAGWSPGSAAARNQAPVANLSALPAEGSAPLEVLLDASASRDPEGDELSFAWELPAGARDDRELLVLVLEEHGRYEVRLGVTDSFGASDRTEVTIVVSEAVSTSFVRGDANADGAVNVSDAIWMLRYLFSGGEAPECVEAADADDSGEVLLSDAVYLLRHLFGRGPAPLSPYRDCGQDETEDALSCAAYPPCAGE